MAPFYEPCPVVEGFKERIESLIVEGDRLFIGTGSGSLHIFNVDQSEGSKKRSSLVTNKNLSRKPIEQLGYIKDINSLVVLCDSSVTLYPLPDLVPPTPLPQTRKAFSFAVQSFVQDVSVDGKIQSFDERAASPPSSRGVPTVVTHLVVGCQRKMVVYSWRDGEAQEVKEANLPHSARTIAFVKPDVLCLAYSTTEHVMFFIETMSTSELTMPTPAIPTSTSIGGLGMNTLTGLGGYMTLGLAAKAKPLVMSVGDSVLIPKDNIGVLFGADGKSKQDNLLWHAPPEDIAYVKPYVLSILPAGSVPASSLPDSLPMAAPVSQNGMILSPVIEIQSTLTSQGVQSLLLPSTTSSSGAPGGNYSIRLLTASPASKAPAYAVSQPSDRNVAAVAGSTIWTFQMRTWGEQVDELIAAEAYEDALLLLKTIDKATLPDKEARESKIRGLGAVSQFRSGEFDKAINTFIELDTNPAKVVALYPESISGRLHLPPERWIPLFGGPERAHSTDAKMASEDAKAERTLNASRPPSPSSSMRAKGKSPLDALKQTAGKEDDAASIRSRTKEKTVDQFTRSVETLLRYLSDRRPKVTGALAAVHITPSQSHQFPFLSETSVEDLLALPSSPLSSLSPEQLTRFAQIVDTALFKSYLVIRPGLLGPLCRLDNWCEVSEVEEVLQEREKYSELMFLYNGKKMHAKALKLLKRLSEKETDNEEKLRPTVTYVQKLGPEYLDHIFEASRWVHGYDSNMTFEIFSSEQVELPRSQVADFLEELDVLLCAKYLEYLISEREETTTLFHDRLAELYLDMVVSARKKGDKESQAKAYSKLLGFIETSDLYRVDRLFGLLPPEDLFEARAILLGRLGRHEDALKTYVYRLHDYIKAEEYCKSIYLPSSPTQSVFLTLLKIYLQPSQKQQANLLKPALDLVSRQSPRLDPVETLQLLPPLVTAEEVKAFLCEAVREPIFDTQVVRELRMARNVQVARKLMVLQNHRVKVTDSRICPQCHKRLGNSVIAVHAPRGEVTHYQCREAFARRRA